jgi:capsular polysaccharide transport system permease protein
MTTKPKAKKFRIRRTPSAEEAASAAPTSQPTATGPVPPTAAALAAAAAGVRPATPVQPAMRGRVDSPAQVAAETSLDAIRQEGLTGRQLRMARRVAQKHGLAVTSDFDAVRQLRAKGIDPFERSSIIDLVTPDPNAVVAMPTGGAVATAPNGGAIGRIQLPQTVPQKNTDVGFPNQPSPSERRESEIRAIQVELTKRRRRKLIMLGARLGVFVGLPTLLCAIYFFAIATPMYATKTEFVIQKSEAAASGAGGLAGLFQGTSLANAQDSITVQSFLTSRDAMVRLDNEHGFKSVFSSENIDPIQRLPADATNEQAYRVYVNHMKVAFDPTEGIIKMEVIAPDPQTSQIFSEALVGYAEEQVDTLTERLRNDQMSGALKSFQEADARRQAALEELVKVQNATGTLETGAEASNIFGQISQLESEKTQKVLELAGLQNVRRPNQSRVTAIQDRINLLDGMISDLRAQLTTAVGSANSLASNSAALRQAEENYQFQLVMVQQAQTMMETARLEANRQTRYLSMGVRPVAPDEPTYPKAFENSVVAFLVFAGIYLMISLTASILREQVAS